MTLLTLMMQTERWMVSSSARHMKKYRQTNKQTKSTKMTVEAIPHYKRSVRYDMMGLIV